MQTIREVNSTGRKGEWITLRYSDRFYIQDPRPEDFHIEEIAHSLAMLSRWGGKSPFFYSVAQHCVHVAAQVPHEYKREALLHDRAECYLGADIVRPLKKVLTKYTALEKNILKVSAPVFNVPAEMSDVVHEADTRMLVTEATHMFRTHPTKFWLDDMWPPAYPMRIESWPPEVAYRAFLSNWRTVAG